MRRTLVALALLASCGDDPYTWGELSEAIGREWCVAVKRCGYFVPNIDGCVEHTRFHWCVYDDNCDVEIDFDQAAADLLADCSAAFEQPDDDACWAWSRGVMPRACIELANRFNPKLDHE